MIPEVALQLLFGDVFLLTILMAAIIVGPSLLVSTVGWGVNPNVLFRIDGLLGFAKLIPTYNFVKTTL